MKISRALVSVTDKSGLADFCRELSGLGVEIISTGGTAKLLKDSGIPVTEISDYTGFPEILGGRVKTLHPKVHAGILYRREEPGDIEQVKKLNLPPIDMVVVNLYQFGKAIQRPGITLDEAIEQIDIGGPTLLRASAKNFRYVTVVCDPSDYGRIIEEMKANSGVTLAGTRLDLARKVFGMTSSYDSSIFTFLKDKAI